MFEVVWCEEPVLIFALFNFQEKQQRQELKNENSESDARNGWHCEVQCGRERHSGEKLRTIPRKRVELKASWERNSDITSKKGKKYLEKGMILFKNVRQRCILGITFGLKDWSQERNCGQYLEREELVPILPFYKFWEKWLTVPQEREELKGKWWLGWTELKGMLSSLSWAMQGVRG